MIWLNKGSFVVISQTKVERQPGHHFPVILDIKPQNIAIESHVISIPYAVDRSRTDAHQQGGEGGTGAIKNNSVDGVSIKEAEVVRRGRTVVELPTEILLHEIPAKEDCVRSLDPGQSIADVNVIIVLGIGAVATDGEILKTHRPE